ncbi:hypothetical protein HPB52_008148 [Rhipicephalus sanguineus]|uniref:Uncharacterized protein n=1 Tax=Rhipicephalus sanguineus TaxID=34632 RepID=A0A9D4PI01_RHISA|nr:hypothetical protein HPB52_008148 [Rhipicephalus sanguineus]
MDRRQGNPKSKELAIHSCASPSVHRSTRRHLTLTLGTTFAHRNYRNPLAGALGARICGVSAWRGVLPNDGTAVNTPPRRNNYGGVSDKGPWIFGMLCVSTKELRLFEVDKRDAPPLHTRPRECQWTPLNLDWHTVNHSVNFIDPATGANTQRIESEWQKAKDDSAPIYSSTSRAPPTTSSDLAVSSSSGDKAAYGRS